MLYSFWQVKLKKKKSKGWEEQMVLLGTEHRGPGAGVPGPEGQLGSQNSLIGDTVHSDAAEEGQGRKCRTLLATLEILAFTFGKGRTMTCFKEGMNMIQVRFYQDPSGYHVETRL